MTNEELVQLYQQGNSQALANIIELNRGIVYKVANKFYIEGSNSMDREDLEQEGYMGLMIAAERYDINNPKKAKFITYAIHWIYHKISRYINSKSTNEEISLSMSIGKDGDQELMNTIEDVDHGFENIEEMIYKQQLRGELEKVMHEYTTLKERNIIKLHYGWDNDRCMNLIEIGNLYNVTRSTINNIESRALGKIRRSPWGAKMANEIYGHKRKRSMYSIPGTIESINFAQRYLFDEVM